MLKWPAVAVNRADGTTSAWRTRHCLGLQQNLFRSANRAVQIRRPTPKVLSQTFPYQQQECNSTRLLHLFLLLLLESRVSDRASKKRTSKLLFFEDNRSSVFSESRFCSVFASHFFSSRDFRNPPFAFPKLPQWCCRFSACSLSVLLVCVCV